MSEPSEPNQDAAKLREQIIGFGTRSLRKSYYPQLQQQIAELQQAKTALLEVVGDLEAARLRAEESEKQFRTLFTEIADGIIVVDAETLQFRKVNSSFCRMLGYTEAELLQLSTSDIHPPEELPRLMEEFAKHRGGTSVLIQNLPFKRKDGGIFYADVNVIGINLENRSCLLGVCRDITERKQSEEALRASEAKFRLVADNTYAWEFWISPEGQFLYTSPSCHRITGHAAHEFLADPELLYRIVHPDDQSSLLRHRNAVSYSKISGEFEFRVIRPDGTVRWIGHACQPVFSADGQYLGVRGSNQDITERKCAEESLRASQEQLRLLVAQAPIAVAMLDRDMNYLATSRRWIAEYGRGYDDLTGLNHYDIKYDMPDYWRDVHRKALEGEPQECEEDRWVLADGTVNWLRWAVHPWRDAHQQIGGLIISTEDITKRKQAEDALKESEYRYAMAQRAANIGSWDWSIQTDQVRWSECIEPMFGYAPGQFPGTNEAFIQSVHPDDRQLVRDAVDASVKGQKNYVIEHRIVWPDGTIRWVSETGDVQRDEHGNPVRMFGIVKDITERKQAEEAQRQSESLIRAVFDNTPFELWARDKEGRCIMENAALVKNWGTILGRQPEDTPVSSEILAIWQENNRRAYAGEFVQGEVEYLKAGEKKIFQNIVAPIRVGENIIGILGLNIDITDQKLAEESLRKAKDAAEVANQAKDQFIAVLSHELRTPLMPVLATLNAMESGEQVSPEMREDMALIRRSVEMEAKLIDDLLDVTKISRGKVALLHETVDAHDCLQTALTICQNDIESKHLEISLNLEASQHHVWADPTRLGQVFWNLLSNAVKFTPEKGRITLRSSNVGEQLRIEIADTGIGIEPELLPRIFNVFEQGQRSKSRRFGGLGLGLSIAKAMVDMHHGTLSVFSAGKDEGAAFTVELPAVPAVAQVLPPVVNAAIPEGQPRKILLVDDHDDTLQTMSRLLRRWGYDVGTATCVRGALEQAAKERYDLLISDLGLPDGSGLDIMGDVQSRYGMPGIALSGYGTEEDIRQSRDAGFRDHLVKPVSFDVLRATIQRVMADAIQPH